MNGPCTHTPTSSLKAEVHVLLVCQAGNGNIQKIKPTVGGHRCQYLPANSRIILIIIIRQPQKEGGRKADGFTPSLALLHYNISD